MPETEKILAGWRRKPLPVVGETPYLALEAEIILTIYGGSDMENPHMDRPKTDDEMEMTARRNLARLDADMEPDPTLGPDLNLGGDGSSEKDDMAIVLDAILTGETDESRAAQARLDARGGTMAEESRVVYESLRDYITRSPHFAQIKREAVERDRAKRRALIGAALDQRDKKIAAARESADIEAVEKLLADLDLGDPAADPGIEEIGEDDIRELNEAERKAEEAESEPNEFGPLSFWESKEAFWRRQRYAKRKKKLTGEDVRSWTNKQDMTPEEREAHEKERNRKYQREYKARQKMAREEEKNRIVKENTHTPL